MTARMRRDARFLIAWWGGHACAVESDEAAAARYQRAIQRAERILRGEHGVHPFCGRRDTAWPLCVRRDPVTGEEDVRPVKWPPVNVDDLVARELAIGGVR